MHATSPHERAKTAARYAFNRDGAFTKDEPTSTNRINLPRHAARKRHDLSLARSALQHCKREGCDCVEALSGQARSQAPLQWVKFAPPFFHCSPKKQNPAIHVILSSLIIHCERMSTHSRPKFDKEEAQILETCRQFGVFTRNDCEGRNGIPSS